MNKSEGFNNRKKGIIIIIHFHRNVEMNRRKKKRKGGRNETPATSLYYEARMAWYICSDKKGRARRKRTRCKERKYVDGKLFKGMRFFEQVSG